jgi:hypothetical protein
MRGESPREKYKTLALAAIWVLALTVGLTLRHLEIFLVLAPLSAGIYLLISSRA